MTDKIKKSLIERFAERAEGASPRTDSPLAERISGSSKQHQKSNGFAAGLDARSQFGSGGKSRNHAEIDFARLEKQGFVTPDSGRSKIVEEFRAIKRPLLLNAFNGDTADGFGSAARNHIIMVTSTKPNEGKTFVSINLAMSIASERGLNVLLVDADVVKRDLPSQLGFYAERGFLDLLENESLSTQDVMIRTNIPNLSILPSGEHVDQATELLASPHMISLMSDLATRYSDRVIIIDTPPILLSSETSVLASHVGQVVLVVEANETSQSDVTQAISLLSGCDNISLVLNKVTDRRASERFGAYSYYYNKD